MVTVKYCYHRCCKKIGYDLVLRLCANELVSHNPFRFMCAAVVRKYQVTLTVPVIWAGCTVTAAAAVIIIDCQHGNGFICSAVQTGMVDQGEAKAS